MSVCATAETPLPGGLETSGQRAFTGILGLRSRGLPCLVNRSSVAGAVLQTPLSLLDSAIQ